MKKHVASLVSKVSRGGGAALGEAIASSLARRRPFRLWMTGSLAVVMLSPCVARPMRDTLDTDRRSNNHRAVHHSRYDVGETLQRMEAMAHTHGLSVLARMPGKEPWLVLASSVGGTPVIMKLPDSPPDMPLSLQVCESQAGGADVMLATDPDEPDSLWQELPSSVVRDIVELPRWVEAALN